MGDGRHYSVCQSVDADFGTICRAIRGVCPFRQVDACIQFFRLFAVFNDHFRGLFGAEKKKRMKKKAEIIDLTFSRNDFAIGIAYKTHEPAAKHGLNIL